MFILDDGIATIKVFRHKVVSDAYKNQLVISHCFRNTDTCTKSTTWIQFKWRQQETVIWDCTIALCYTVGRKAHSKLGQLFFVYGNLNFLVIMMSCKLSHMTVYPIDQEVPWQEMHGLYISIIKLVSGLYYCNETEKDNRKATILLS